MIHYREDLQRRCLQIFAQSVDMQARLIHTCFYIARQLKFFYTFSENLGWTTEALFLHIYID